MSLLSEGDKALSILKNPFAKDNVTDISIRYRKGWFSTRDPTWYANIDFENGNTKGTQKFEVKGADGLGTILKQMEEFMKSL